MHKARPGSRSSQPTSSTCLVRNAKQNSRRCAMRFAWHRSCACRSGSVVDWVTEMCRKCSMVLRPSAESRSGREVVSRAILVGLDRGTARPEKARRCDRRCRSRTDRYRSVRSDAGSIRGASSRERLFTADERNYSVPRPKCARRTESLAVRFAAKLAARRGAECAIAGLARHRGGPRQRWSAYVIASRHGPNRSRDRWVWITSR